MATIVLTGASAGIGAAAAVELTAYGHTVVASGRSEAKLAAVHERMVQIAPPDLEVPEPILADLADLDDVRHLAASVLDRCDVVDVLVNNAGLHTRQRQESADGFELMFAVNHLAPFLLSNLLGDRLAASDGRVVTTSSSAHRIGKIDFDDLQHERSWRSFRVYGTTKLANIWFTSELGRRAALPASCFHPGSVNTELGRDSWLANLIQPVLTRGLRTPEHGADTMVWLATSDEGAAPRAVYYVDRKPGRTSSRARDAASAARLWDVSSELVGLA
jgi:NAD(P)-dependent dehydrogenase (short-subunit alcohol dehydrogenase family)